MNIVEQFIASKIDDMRRCEDGIFVSEHFIAVIDGVTSKGQYQWGGETSGFRAKEIIKQTLGTLGGMESKEKVFQTINDALRGSYHDIDFFFRNHEERLQATMVIYSVEAAQVWQFGDCPFLVDGTEYFSEMKIDSLLSEFRSVFLELEMRGGTSIDTLCEKDLSQELIFPILKRQFLFSNTDGEYGYAVLDGFCEDFSRIKTVDVPHRGEVVLATDGYPMLYSDLQESEQYLDWLRENDPLCIRLYKSTRGFTNGKTSLDDRAYIRFTT